MLTTDLEIFRNQLQRTANAYPREIRILPGRDGWLNIAFARPDGGKVLGSWGYHPGQGRWSYGQAPSADAEVVAQVVAAVSAPRKAAAVPAGALEDVTGIPLDEGGEY